jgi:hypothetical protein
MAGVCARCRGAPRPPWRSAVVVSPICVTPTQAPWWARTSPALGVPSLCVSLGDFLLESVFGHDFATEAVQFRCVFLRWPVLNQWQNASYHRPQCDLIGSRSSLKTIIAPGACRHCLRISFPRLLQAVSRSSWHVCVEPSQVSLLLCTRRVEGPNIFSAIGRGHV